MSRTMVAEPVVHRGVLVRDLELKFVACGGTVNKSDPDHHKWRYPGRPTVDRRQGTGQEF